VFWLDVMLIFFLEGLTLPGAAMRQAAGKVGVHVMTQLFNLLLIPMVTAAVVSQLATAEWMTPTLRDGFLALACIPCAFACAVSIASPEPNLTFGIAPQPTT
jgi:predicted Na+-dependent transporter